MPSVSGDEGVGSLVRVAYAVLSGRLSRPGNIDLSPAGTTVLLTDETLHVMTPALGMSPLLDADLLLKSHLDAAQSIPVLHYPISIQSVPSDVSSAGSGGEAYAAAYEPRFLDAKWSPVEVGPHQSAILAALTTQFQLCLFKAEKNQFKGPWEQAACLTGGQERQIVSMCWVQDKSSHPWLLAGTRQGDLMVWELGVEGPVLRTTTPFCKADITALYPSPDGLLALVTSDEVRIARERQGDHGRMFRSTTHQPGRLDGSHVSLARWQGTELLYCTPGQVHLFDAKTGRSQRLLLKDSGEEESCCFRPASAISWLRRGEWEVVLQDGCQYQVTGEAFARPDELLAPASHLPPANEVIGALQRRVEATRGLFAKHDDGSGLILTCHDANEIASWSFHRDPKCHFGLSIAHSHAPDRDNVMAAKLLDGALRGRLQHLQALIAFYAHYGNKSDVLPLVQQSLQRQFADRTYFQAALRLSTWAQREQTREGKDKAANSIHDGLVDENVARALLERLGLLCSDAAQHDAADAAYCNRLAAAASSLADRLGNVALAQASRQLIDKVGHGGDVSAVEACAACGSSIGRASLEPGAMLLARCHNGHLWKRCATSLAVLTTSLNRICSVCSSETMQPGQAASAMQRRLLEATTACDLCGGKHFV